MIQDRMRTNCMLLQEAVFAHLKRRRDPQASRVFFGNDGWKTARWFKAQIPLSPLEFSLWFCQKTSATLLSDGKSGVVKLRISLDSLIRVAGGQPLVYERQEVYGLRKRSVRSLVYAKYSHTTRKLSVHFLIETLINGRQVESIARNDLFRR